MAASETSIRLLVTMALLAPFAGCGVIGSGESAAREQIIEYGTPSEFLICSQPGAGATVDTVIGPGGGILRAGVTELSIPAGALADERRFVLQQDTGQRVSVTINGEPGRTPPPPLLKGATLRIDVSGCSAETLANPRGWWVWRMSATPGRSQKLRTDLNPREATTVIDSTSKFMIAN
ncbi:MAG TPA: hypothetical protein VK912_10480 [Longimicrobiales bacterium]|nr:hypothetical protein [Longimicrobiales bacterium]